MINNIEKGDVFFIERKTWLGKFINWGQRIVSADGDAVYNHSGMFRDSITTLESLWKVESHDFFERYNGLKVVIFRPLLDSNIKSAAIDRIVTEDYGERYPWYRFFVLVAPPIAKYIDNGKSVCSELVAKYLYICDIRHKYYQGTTPDKLVDEMRIHKRYKLIYEGKISG